MRIFSKKQISYFVIGMVLFSWIFHSYLHKSHSNKSSAIAVTVSSVQQKDVTLTTHAIGNVEPAVSVSVKSRVDGQLLSVGFKEGDYVKEGQIIFQIDPQPFKVALQQAQANLAHDEAELDNFKKTLDRYIPLMKKGYVSKQEYDQASANAKAQEAVVMADQANVANAQLNLDYCTIRATISGRTGNLLVNPGNLIKASDPSALVVINQIKPIYIAFSLPEHQLATIQDDLKKGILDVNIQVKNIQTIYHGHVSFVDNAVDSSTGTIKLKAIFDNQNEELWPGEYVDVTLPYVKLTQALVIPTRAIQAGPDGSYVFVVNKDKSVSLKLITAESVVDDNTVVQGLKPGEEIVTTGQAQLVDGSVVEIG